MRLTGEDLPCLSGELLAKTGLDGLHFLAKTGLDRQQLFAKVRPERADLFPEPGLRVVERTDPLLQDSRQPRVGGVVSDLPLQERSHELPQNPPGEDEERPEDPATGRQRKVANVMAGVNVREIGCRLFRELLHYQLSLCHGTPAPGESRPDTAQPSVTVGL